MLLPRAKNSNSDNSAVGVDKHPSTSKGIVIAVVVIAVLLSFAVVAYLFLKNLRTRTSNSKYIPTEYLKQKWRAWNPAGLPTKGNYSSRLQDNSSVPTLHLRSDNRSARGSTLSLADPERAAAARAAENTTNGATVDRHTSVRSVMTLPAYSQSARENEQILGREGERDGMDVVVEHAETQEEEEARRDGEMESLYQIRLQRRQEIADREARRQERRDARARGDFTTLERLRQESALRAQHIDPASASAMIAEHQSRSRDRRVSSVSYADLGVARHDGSRIRANSRASNDSDRPLLDSAASIAGHSVHPQTSDSASIGTRGRARSASSVMSVSDTETETEQRPSFGRAGSDFEIVTLNQTHSRNASASHTPAGKRSRATSNVRPGVDTSVDIADEEIPSADPPEYMHGYEGGDGFEEAPPYSSPVEQRVGRRISTIHEANSPVDGGVEMPRIVPPPVSAPVLPELGRLPSIRIGEATPVDARAGVEWPSPVREEREER